MTEEIGTHMADKLDAFNKVERAVNKVSNDQSLKDSQPNDQHTNSQHNERRDKFFITLTQEDQNKVLACLASGQFENPSDFIRHSISASHQNLAMARDVNRKFRVGMTSLRERLERYQRD